MILEKRSCCTGILFLCGFAWVGPFGGGAALKGAPVPQKKGFTIEFDGNVDGSERLEINATEAVWQHLHREWPKAPVKLNGIIWDLSKTQKLANAGNTRFVDPGVDFTRAKLEVLEGRDIVVLTKTKGGVIVYINDTNPDAGRYRFRISFDNPAAEPKPVPNATEAMLTVRARIDGSDVLRITQGEAKWEHKQWGWPTDITLNGVAWNAKRQPMLANEGKTQFLPQTVDFSTARVTRKAGRDLAVLVYEGNGITVYFADNPNGADDYELVISFGQRDADQGR
jgi:hypothetical protein